MATGALTQPVTFASAQRYAAPVSGDWQGLTFRPGSVGNLVYASVEFAATGLTLDGATTSVISSTIAASQADGIRISSPSTVILTITPWPATAIMPSITSAMALSMPATRGGATPTAPPAWATRSTARPCWWRLDPGRRPGRRTRWPCSTQGFTVSPSPTFLT